MKYPIKCECGSLVGEVIDTEAASRCVCYCRDCRAFPHYLGCPDQTLDSAGGTEIVQTNPANVRFTSGLENLGCLKLSDKGLLRWYAKCCNTPIGNTPATMQLPFVGLVHTCLRGKDTPALDAFGKISAVVNTGSAPGEPKPRSLGMPGYLFRVMGLMLRARLNGGYKRGPFFEPTTGEPVLQPYVLSPEERAPLAQD